MHSSSVTCNAYDRGLRLAAVSSPFAGSAIAQPAADAEDVYVPALLARPNASQSVSSRRDDAGQNHRHADGIGAMKLEAAPRYQPRSACARRSHGLAATRRLSGSQPRSPRPTACGGARSSSMPAVARCSPMINLRAAADINRRRKRKAMLAAIVEHGFGVQGRVGVVRRARLAFVETARAAASARGPACLTKIARRAPRAPRQHARRRPIGAHGELEPAVALRESSGHFWQRFALLRIAVQCGEATDEAVDIPQPVSLIREIKNPLRFRQPSPIDVQRIEWPVRIVGCEQNELGLPQPVAVAVRVDYRRQLPPVPRIDALGEPNLLVILDLLRQPAERLPLQLDLRPHVEHVDDHRSYARHAGIDGRGEP